MEMKNQTLFDKECADVLIEQQYLNCLYYDDMTSKYSPSRPHIDFEPLPSMVDQSCVTFIKPEQDKHQPNTYGVVNGSLQFLNGGSISPTSYEEFESITQQHQVVDDLHSDFVSDVLSLLVVDSDEKFTQSMSFFEHEKKHIGVCLAQGCRHGIKYQRGFCKQEHGGKQLCSKENCPNVPQGKRFCISHGGGKPCKVVNCTTAAQSHGACKKHGGGTRCKVEGCTKSSQGKNLCRTHGGGKRCKYEGCSLGSQRGNFCAKHGGVRECKITSCSRKDRGGGFCDTHRQNMLCRIPDCNKLMVNKTKCLCKRHNREKEIENQCQE